MTKHNSSMRILARDFALCAGTVLLLHFLFAAISGKHLFADNPYNSYVIQVQSWLSGRLDVDYYSWLELAEFGGKYYVSFPPFPSYVLFLPVLLFGAGVDSVIALLSVLLGAACGVKLCHNMQLGSRQAVLLTCLLYLGTNMWQITVDAWVWFLAQNLSVTLCLMSFCFASEGMRGSSVFFLACAVGCRPFQILYLPLVFLLLWQSEKRTRESPLRFLFGKFYVYLPALTIGASYMALNYFRFGNPFEFGHNYLPEFTQAAEGQFSLSYIPENFGNLFRLTEGEGSVPWKLPQFNGMNLFLVIPLFCLYPIFAVAAFLRERSKKAVVLHTLTLLLIFMHIFLLLMHRTMGGYHFGNRYLLDTVPALFLITAAAAGKMKRDTLFSVCTQTALLFGLALNFYGTLSSYGI